MARTPLLIGASLVVHVAILLVAFVMREPEPTHPPLVVAPVLYGHVDAETGDFHATGFAQAIVRR
jgi:hypothetical protein